MHYYRATLQYMNEHILVTAAVLLAIIGNVPYLFNVLTKKIKPHPYTWFIWSIVSMVTLFAQIQKGGGLAVIPTAAAEIFTIIIFILSIKYGFKDIDKRDNIFLVIALLGLIPWAITKDPTISVIVVVCIDLVAFIPTLIKTYRQPESESSILFIANVLRHVITLYLVEKINIATTLHSLTMIVTNTLMVIFIHRRRK
jgi:hypothetical protein